MDKIKKIVKRVSEFVINKFNEFKKSDLVKKVKSLNNRLIEKIKKFIKDNVPEKFIASVAGSGIFTKFSKMAKKVSSKFKTMINDEDTLLKKFTKAMCIVGSALFGVLCLYLLKEVFVKTLVMAATIGAIVISVELIYAMLDIAIGVENK